MLIKYGLKKISSQKDRLVKRAQTQAEEKNFRGQEAYVVTYSLNHVTDLIEQNKAQLVVVAHDVDPIELVVWLPALCRKMEIPYCIVNGKACLGTVRAQSSVLDHGEERRQDGLSKIPEAIKANFNEKYDEYRKEEVGGGMVGSNSQAKSKAKEMILAKEATQILNLIVIIIST